MKLRSLAFTYIAALGLLALGGLALAQAPGVNTNFATTWSIPNDSAKQTYSVGSGGYTVASSPTDVFQICGSATKVIKVTKVSLAGRATTAAVTGWRLNKLSTAGTGGTATTETRASYDSSQGTPSATVKAYTANGTAGTILASIATGQYFLGTLTSTASERATELFFGDRPAKAVTLRGVAQCASIHLEATSNSGNVWNFGVEWTEE